MRKIVQRAVILLLYLFLLLGVTGFRWDKVLDLRSVAMVTAGMLLLSLPWWLQEVREQKKKQSEHFAWSRLVCPLAGNALLASYLTTAVTLLTGIYGEIEPNQVAGVVALGCRPILYGLFYYALFKVEKETGNATANGESNNTVKSMTPEQLSYFFRAKGLTAREAEVARLLYLNYSNRQIAGELYIAETTVKKHVTHILMKLEIEQREQIREIVKKNF